MVLSFYVAFVFYVHALGQKKLPILAVVSLYLVLGIGVDAIFVTNTCAIAFQMPLLHPPLCSFTKCADSHVHLCCRYARENALEGTRWSSVYRMVHLVMAVMREATLAMSVMSAAKARGGACAWADIAACNVCEQALDGNNVCCGWCVCRVAHLDHSAVRCVPDAHCRCQLRNTAARFCASYDCMAPLPFPHPAHLAANSGSGSARCAGSKCCCSGSESCSAPSSVGHGDLLLGSAGGTYMCWRVLCLQCSISCSRPLRRHFGSALRPPCTAYAGG